MWARARARRVARSSAEEASTRKSRSSGRICHGIWKMSPGDTRRYNFLKPPEAVHSRRCPCHLLWRVDLVPTGDPGATTAGSAADTAAARSPSPSPPLSCNLTWASSLLESIETERMRPGAAPAGTVMTTFWTLSGRESLSFIPGLTFGGTSSSYRVGSVASACSGIPGSPETSKRSSGRTDRECWSRLGSAPCPRGVVSSLRGAVHSTVSGLDTLRVGELEGELEGDRDARSRAAARMRSPARPKPTRSLKATCSPSANTTRSPEPRGPTVD